MIVLLFVILLMTAIGQLAMSFGVLKLLRRANRTSDRIIESLEVLHDLIKLLANDERLCE